MVATVKIDKANSIVLPKRMREELRLSPGNSLEVECSDGCVILRPVRGEKRIYKMQGVLGYEFGRGP
jgi:AbrB family looped-hinge helix DNA binding protein